MDTKYSKEEELHDMKILEYLKNNHEEAYENLKASLPKEYPEDWNGNFMKIWKLDAGIGSNLFHWFSDNIPIL